MKMLHIFSLAAMICMAAACCSSVTVSIGPALFGETLEQTPRPQLVDERTLREYAEERLPDAILMDIREASFDTLILTLDKDRPVFVYCRSGKRSMDAAKILKKNNFKTIYNLEGGILLWKEKGKPTER